MSTLYVDNLQPNLGSRVMAAGHVVQVVHASSQNNAASSGGAYNALEALSVSITPTSATSKFLVFYQVTVVGAVDIPYASWVTRNGTVVGVESTSNNTYASISTSAGSASEYSDGDAPDTVTGQMLDTPNTTDELTYRVYVGTRRDATKPFRLGYSLQYSQTGPDQSGWQLSATHKITVMEIAQ